MYQPSALREKLKSVLVGIRKSDDDVDVAMKYSVIPKS